MVDNKEAYTTHGIYTRLDTGTVYKSEPGRSHKQINNTDPFPSHPETSKSKQSRKHNEHARLEGE